MKLSALLVFQLVIIVSIGFAQEPVYIHYTTEDGLPSSEVHAVKQDSKGFIWFATDNGVSRFNGYEFENFSTEDGLMNNVIFDIFEESNGSIWFLHKNNKISILREGKIEPYKFNHIIPRNPPGAVKGRINRFHVDPNGNVILIWARHGFSRITNTGKYEHKGNSFPNSYFVEADSANGLASIYLPSSITTSLTIPNKFLINTSLNIDTQFCLPFNYNVFTSFHYSKCYMNDKVAFNIGNLFFIVSDSTLKRTTLPSSAIFIYHENNNLWVGMPRKGALLFKNPSAELSKYETFLNDYSVTGILKDNENGVWFTTLDDGVFYSPNINIKTLNDDNIIPHNNCKLLCANNNQMYFSLKGKDLYKIGKDYHLLKLNEAELLFIKNLTQIENELFCQSGDYIFQERNNHLVKLVKFDTTNKTKLYHKTYSANSLCKIADNDYIIVYHNGLSIVRFEDDRKIVIADRDRFPLLNNVYINDIEKQMEFNYLLATDKGLFSIEIDTAYYCKSKVVSLQKKHSLFNKRINEITFNSYDSRHYLVTKSNGLIIWDTKKDTVVCIERKDGILDNLITSIRCKDSLVFLGTKHGLNIMKVDKNSLSFSIEKYTIKSGLPTNEINDIDYIDSTLCLATNKGICVFELSDLKANDLPPPIFIANIAINEKDTSIFDHYNFPYYQNNINIHYIGLAYKSQNDIQYKFRLLGSDTTWKFTKNRELRFPNLSSGKYSFEVMAQNEDGYWSKEPARVSFTIKPPYWKTWWFRSIIGINLLLLIWLVFQYRMRELKKRNLIRIEEERKRNKLKQEAEKKLTQTKQKLVTQQLNPHFLFNTMSSIQYMIINNQKMEAVGLLSKFAHMMRQGLEYSRVEYALLDQSIEFFKNYIDLKSIVLEEKIEVVMDTSKIASVKDCSIPPMLIQPFIENAIIHGLTPKKKQMLLKLSFFEIGKNIKCTIEDNGIGRKQSAKLKEKQEESYKSFGVKIINETLGMMNDLHGENYQVKYTDLIDANKKACGTRVEISFPKMQ